MSGNCLLSGSTSSRRWVDATSHVANQYLIGRSDRYHGLCFSIGISPGQSQLLRLLLLIFHGRRGRSGGGSHQTALTPIAVTTAKHPAVYLLSCIRVRRLLYPFVPFTSNSASTLRLARTSGCVSGILWHFVVGLLQGWRRKRRAVAWCWGNCRLIG
jgi:hypothetical protein